MVAIYVFILSCFVGYHVIWGVTPALHTPLMAVTNAISGIVLVGAILVAGMETSSTWVSIVGCWGVFLASINIFGGFVVTNRMLAMFKKKR
jgi:NAD(P) transhydrogenase subunit alpha